MQNRLTSAILAGIFALPCYAKTIGETNNGSGGKIVITNELCNDNKHYLAYSYANGQPNLFGCWVHDDSGIHIRWYDGDIRTYPYQYWKIQDTKPTL